MRHRGGVVRSLIFSFFWALVLLLGFYIRVIGVSALPPDQFTEADAYLYFEQAREISVSGRLGVRDFRRWLPEGRDGRQSLSL